jgi:NhaP-type Na+/H+ or K+/H+ antiporter
MDTLIYLAALLIFLYGLISAVADRSPITAPMVFVAIGVLAGPLGFGLFEVNIDSHLVEIIAEVTLVIILFTDASSIKLKALQKEYTVPLRLLAIGLPLTIVAGFALADQIGGNGFISAFCAGLFLAARSKTVRTRIQEFGEAEGQQLSLFIFLMFGMVLVPVAQAYWDWAALVYALLSLTVIRMVPVALALIGTKLDLPTVAFIGWFGPAALPQSSTS